MSFIFGNPNEAAGRKADKRWDKQVEIAFDTANDTLEDLIPIILGTRSLIEVVDDSGNSMGYISDSEASKFLSKD